MTFLKSVKSAVALLAVAGVLVFAGGAFAQTAITPAAITGINAPETGEEPDEAATVLGGGGVTDAGSSVTLTGWEVRTTGNTGIAFTGDKFGAGKVYIALVTVVVDGTTEGLPSASSGWTDWTKLTTGFKPSDADSFFVKEDAGKLKLRIFYPATDDPDQDDVDGFADALAEALGDALPVAQADLESQNEAGIKAYFNAIIEEVAEDEGIEDVTASVAITDITAAVAGTSSSTSGTNGSFKYLITLTKGEASATVPSDGTPASADITAKAWVNDATAVNNAKTALNISAVTTFSVAQASVNTAALALAAVNGKINAVTGWTSNENADGVVATVVQTGFTAAVAGTATSVSGTNGSYAFKIKLERGSSTDETITGTVTINATAFAGTVRTITYNSTPTGGTLAAALTNGTAIASGGTVANGATVVFTATPSSGNQVQKFTLGGADAQVGSATTYTVNSVSSNITVQVVFEAVPYISATLIGFNADNFQVNRPITWVVVYKLTPSKHVKWAGEGNGTDGGPIDTTTATTNASPFKLLSTSIPAGLTHKIRRIDSVTVTDTIKGNLPASAGGSYSFTVQPLTNTFIVADGSAAPGTPPSSPGDRTASKVSGFPVGAQSIKAKATIAQSNITIDNAAATFAVGTVRKVTPAIQSAASTALTSDGGTVYFHVTYRLGGENGEVVSEPKAGDTATANYGVINAGTYHVSVRAFNKYNEGTKTTTFVVNKKDISGITLTATTAGTLTWTGESQEENVALSVKDGSAVLEEGVDWEGAKAKSGGVNGKTAFDDPVSAGASLVKINGIGNYSGTKSTTFNINKKRIYVDTTAMTEYLTKTYNGVAAYDTTGIGAVTDFVQFATAQTAGDPVELKHLTNYTVTGNFVNASGANVADSVSANRVKLSVTLSNTGNYTLSAQATATNGGSADVLKKATITRATPNTDHFNYAKPDTFHHAYTGRARGIGDVTVKSPFTGMGRFRVLYGVNDADTAKPTAVGSYTVTVRVDTLGPNFKAGDVTLGTYVISEPGKPVIADTWKSDVTVRQGVPLTLTVDATAAATGGNLSYQWYRDGVAVSTNGKAASLSVNGLLQDNTYVFRVVVTNTKSAGTAGSEVGTEERSVTVTVIEPPINISGATVAVLGSYTYTGSAIEPPVDSIVVFIPPKSADEDTVKLVAGADYDVSFAKNVNVGSATASISGKETYIGIRTATFPIVKKTPDFTDVSWKAEVVYNGKAQPITVTAAVGTGLGELTVKYDGKAEAPADAGLYVITADFAGGTNYAAATAVPLGFYTINRKKATKDDLVYTQWPAQILVDSAKADGIGAVTLKPNTGDATITVLYGSSADAPTDVGSYPVLVQISNADNFTDDVVELGTYLIVDVVSVAQSGREIPNKVVVEEASVAPIKAFSASFTAGPSPVAKASGEIKFFSTKSVKGGSLYVFDANGNAVAKVAAKQGSGKEVGSWNLKNNKGATVSEGTYVVKGALVGKDGTKEKVSFVFSVK